MHKVACYFSSGCKTHILILFSWFIVKLKPHKALIIF